MVCCASEPQGAAHAVCIESEPGADPLKRERPVWLIDKEPVRCLPKQSRFAVRLCAAMLAHAVNRIFENGGDERLLGDRGAAARLLRRQQDVRRTCFASVFNKRQSLDHGSSFSVRAHITAAATV
jgi:hypothetical protein